MDQFHTYLYSFLEDKDENMIQELFEGDGYELTALGRIRIKNVEIPSPTKSFDCSLNGSSESEDEFYDYIPLLDGTPTKMSKLPSANVGFSSPSSNKPSKLLEKGIILFFFFLTPLIFLGVVPRTSLVASHMPLATFKGILIHSLYLILFHHVYILKELFSL
ncbi:hypothetical protein HYC85_030921 [Camellia sinensis]|uniref:Uncharacterized protein n=1 Tax=Camellia sinensis TaxID=4442 RepID=A0A7J7FQZ8_CAMSI|nr:hypothetical protein HYC85_030921 [Camellia sinensis]